MSRSAELAPLVLTRPAAQQEGWRQALVAQGVPVLGWPLIDIAPAPDPDTLAWVWTKLPLASLAFFASPNAVNAVMSARPVSVGWPKGCWAACVGPGSADALRRAGVPGARILTPPANSVQFDSESLWPLLQRLAPWAGRSVLLLRGQGGREWLADRLRELGADVQAATVYVRSCPQPEPQTLHQLKVWMRAVPAPLWLLSSSEAVGHWQSLAGPLPPLPVLTTHPRITATALDAGLRVTEVPPTVAAVAAAWRQYTAACINVSDAAP